MKLFLSPKQDAIVGCLLIGLGVFMTIAAPHYKWGIAFDLVCGGFMLGEGLNRLNNK